MKLRYPSTRSSDIRMSRPWAASATRVKRKASVPNRSITSRGSMTFPRVLLIFSPLASRTRAWITTSRKGAFPVNSIPIIIIRATQKKRMSNPVTSTDVG
jgi:hypothetical protein